MKSKKILSSIVLVALIACSNSQIKTDAQKFIDDYTKEYLKLSYADSQVQWESQIHIYPDNSVNEKATQAADEALVKFTGSTQNVEAAKKYLVQKDKLDPLQVKQLEKILYIAAGNPEIAEKTVKELIAASNKATEKLYGFDFKLDGKSVSTNDIDAILVKETDMTKRLAAWNESKEVGKTLKTDLVKLRDLRNASVRPLGYHDYFSYNISDYDMSREDMMAMMDRLVTELWPLYRELHTFARYELAKKYNLPVPDELPAEWLPNRWGQYWGDLVKVEGIDLDGILAKKPPQWFPEQAERFYVSLGFPKLPKSFWEKSDLYPAPKDAKYKKNNHASAWHLDTDHDVRSLMSIEPNTEWYMTTHHEFGHIYYYLTYSRPEIPVLLRGGANPAYHEAFGTMIGQAAMQKPFLENLGLIAKGTQSDSTQELLKEALDSVVFVPFAAGTMAHFENDLYATDLPADQFNARWWSYVKKFQGIVPPTSRGEEYCDAASKTHIIDDPAGYYDYALASLIQYQVHEYIAKNILHQDPHATNYYGSKATGDFLRKLMAPGATVDWRKLLKDTTGSELSAKPMVDYFAPLMSYLKEQNKGRKYTLPETL